MEFDDAKSGPVGRLEIILYITDLSFQLDWQYKTVSLPRSLFAGGLLRRIVLRLKLKG